MSVGRVLGNLITKETKFSWEIPNFNTINANFGEAVISPTFDMTYWNASATKSVTLHWRMQLYPNGGYMSKNGVHDTAHSNDFISLCIENLDEIAVSSNFSIALMDRLNTNHFIKVNSTGEWAFGKKRTSGWSSFIQKEVVTNTQNGCLINGTTLMVSCCIFSTRVVCDYDESDDEKECSDASLNHFDMLFNTGKFSDVTFRVGNQEMRVHKSVVTCLSPVFLAMFENQMKEQNENIVDIVDTEFDIIKEMLRYMYLKKVNNIEKIAIDLFIAADKYCVKGLQKFCEKSLCKNLDMENALQRLEMAEQYNMKKLKLCAIRFIAGRLKSFSAKKEFKEMSSGCKNDLMSYIAEKLGDENEQLMSTYN